MGTHGASMRPRALPPARRADKSTNRRFRSETAAEPDLTDWPVARRLFAVIVAALLMGLVFGGLRVADAENSASQFSRTAAAGQARRAAHRRGERSAERARRHLVALISGTTARRLPLAVRRRPRRTATSVPVRPALRRSLGGGFPATVESDRERGEQRALGQLASAPSALAAYAERLHGLSAIANPNGRWRARTTTPTSATSITLQAQVSLGVTDQSLDQRRADAQRAVPGQGPDLAAAVRSLDPALANMTNSAVTDCQRPAPRGTSTSPGETSLQLAYDEELTQEAAFHAAATPAENAEFDSLLGPRRPSWTARPESDTIDQAIFAVAGGGANVKGKTSDRSSRIQNQLRPTQAARPHSADTLTGAPLRTRSAQETRPRATTSPTTPADVQQLRIARCRRYGTRAPGDKLDALQTTEQSHRRQHRQPRHPAPAVRAAEPRSPPSSSPWPCCSSSCWPPSLVARSLVLPLRRLRAGALDIASVAAARAGQAADRDARVRRVVEVAPINVDRRTTRSARWPARSTRCTRGGAAGGRAGAAALQLQRDVRQPVAPLPDADRAPGAMIDNLEQNEDDPDRLGQPVLHGPPGHPHAPQLGEPAAAGRAREPAQVVGAGAARRRRPRRDLGDRAVQPGHAEHPAGRLRHRPGGLRRRAPARRAGRERHDLLPQGHPGPWSACRS